MYRDQIAALVAQVDALHRDLALAERDRDRAAALERELASRTRELDRLRRKVGELPPRVAPPRGPLVAAAALVLAGGAFAAANLSRRPPPRVVAPSRPALAWFNAVRARCNPLEVATALRASPPPRRQVDPLGPAYQAGCYALAGRLTEARATVDALPEAERGRAAGVIFEIAHPVADAGDDRAAGPMMELVLSYWPANYQAMYHAGMAAFATGDRTLARRRLTGFLAAYHEESVFSRNAREVLRRLDGGVGAAPLERE